MDFVSGEAEDIAEGVANTIMLDKLRNSLPLLSEDEQELINLHFFKNVSQVEISKKLGVNQSNISRRIAKILHKLKNLLEN